MARCPFAVQKPISGPSGTYTGGPFKIVHHTTEGSTAAGAFDAFASHRSDPHFTVDATTIYQHIDTDKAARALRNPPGGVQTNRDKAIQIEVVGFAHRPKTKPTLRNVARLCRWIEQTHGVSPEWPNGHPKPARNGRDPGGHNRNAATWDSKGGHYGHCHVPENTHWDPAYTADEVSFLMRVDPDAGDTEAIGEYPSIPDEDPGLAEAVSQMPDHHEVGGDGRPDVKADLSRTVDIEGMQPLGVPEPAGIAEGLEAPEGTEWVEVEDPGVLEGTRARKRRVLG